MNLRKSEIDPAGDVRSEILQAITNALPNLVLQLVQPLPVASALNAEDRIEEKIVSRISGLSVSTIQKLRATSDGPPFEKYGRRCLYRYADVLEWLAKRRASSTADALARGLSKPLTRRKQTQAANTGPLNLDS